MNKLGLWLVMLAPACGLQAQVTVEVRMEQVQFVSKEAMPVSVRIINHSGQTLHLGREPDWLTFAMEAHSGFVVRQTGTVPVLGEFDLESSKVAIKHVDLGPYFSLGKLGHYSVTATVKIKDWIAEVSSGAKEFEIIHGTKLWEQEFGVPPASPDNHGAPEVRKYILQQANYSKQMKLYLRLTDQAEDQVIKVVPIGPMVSFSRPESQLDQQSNLHLVYQCGARLYLYAVVTPAGELVLRQSYDITDTRPHLHVDASGKIKVVDGARRITADDIPRPSEQVLSNEAIAPNP